MKTYSRVGRSLAGEELAGREGLVRLERGKLPTMITLMERCTKKPSEVNGLFPQCNTFERKKRLRKTVKTDRCISPSAATEVWKLPHTRQ